MELNVDLSHESTTFGACVVMGSQNLWEVNGRADVSVCGLLFPPNLSFEESSTFINPAGSRCGYVRCRSVQPAAGVARSHHKCDRDVETL